MLAPTALVRCRYPAPNLLASAASGQPAGGCALGGVVAENENNAR